jgi:hypothetical protein
MVMELSYEELLKNMDQNHTNSTSLSTSHIKSNSSFSEKPSVPSYWDKPASTTENKRVSYDDILSSLNLVVSSDGVLKKMSTKTNSSSSTTNYDGFMNHSTSEVNSIPKTTNSFQPAQFKKSTFNSNVKKIEPELKNSSIYNKYFKNYKDPSIIEEVPRRPLTQCELRDQLINEKILLIKQQINARKVKNKNLAITKPQPPIPIRVNRYNNPILPRANVHNKNHPLFYRYRKMDTRNHLFDFSKK